MKQMTLASANAFEVYGLGDAQGGVSCAQRNMGAVRRILCPDLKKSANRAFATLALHNLVKWGKPLAVEARRASPKGEERY